MKTKLFLTSLWACASLIAAESRASDKSYLEQATQALATKEACTDAFKTILSKRPQGIKTSIETKHLESNPQKGKSYFYGSNADEVLTALKSAGCNASTVNFKMGATPKVECHLTCNNNVGYDVDKANKAKVTKNIMLIYTAHNKNTETPFLIEIHPSEKPE